MALSLSSSFLAIALADERGTLRLEVRPSRLGDTFVAICDERGIIEAANDMAEAEATVAEVRRRMAA